MGDFLNTVLGKAARHLVSALSGALAATGISQGSAEEVVAGLIGYALNLLVSRKLK